MFEFLAWIFGDAAAPTDPDPEPNLAYEVSEIVCSVRFSAPWHPGSCHCDH